MASIYKRSHKWYLAYRANGEQIHRSLRTSSKRLATLKLSEVELALERDELGFGRRLESSGAAFKGFADDIMAKKSPPWQTRMEQLIRPFRTWTESHTRLVTKLTTAEIEEFFRERRKVISAKTSNDELGIVKRFFKWMLSREYLTKDQTASIARVATDPQRTRIFTPNEVQILLRHASPVLRQYFLLLMFTGCREGEIRNLEWQDVDLVQGVIYIRVKVDWAPKTKKGRVVPMLPQTRELLTALPRNGCYVLSTANGERMVYPCTRWNRLVAKIERLEGVDLKGEVSPHTFRHTFATTCLESGLDVITVAEILGHSNASTTRRYLHLRDEHKIEAASKVNFNRLLSAA